MQMRCQGCRSDTDTKDEAGICCECEGQFCKSCCYYDKHTDQVWCFECSEAAVAKHYDAHEEEYVK